MVLVVVLVYWVLHSENPVSQQSSGQTGSTTTTFASITPNSQANAPRTTTTTAAPAHPAQQVITLVANGTSTSGAGERFATALKVRGYDTLAPVNATNSNESTTHVYYIAGYQPDAQVIAEALGLTPSATSAMPSSPPVSSIKSAQVLVVIGADLASQATTSSSTTTSSATASASK